MLINTGVIERAGATLADVMDQTPNASIAHFMAREEMSWDILFLLTCCISH